MTAPAAPARRRPFLTARWESLVLLNYPCRREWLEPLVPSGTELDTWQGETLVRLVGFLFADTRLLGVPVPFHRTFEEVNLRFYVRRPGPDGVMRRAVVFVRELVPRVAIAWTARAIYNEPYLAVPMSHDLDLHPSRGGHVHYGWRRRRHPHLLARRDRALRSRLRRPPAHAAPFGLRGRGLSRGGACGRPYRITASHRCRGVLCHNPEP